MAAIADACVAGTLPAQLLAVVSDQANALGLDAARSRGVPTHCIQARDFAQRADFDRALADCIDCYAPDLLVLAGFMRILGADFVNTRRGRILNIHPSLLPAYPGLHTHRRVLADGGTFHGATVHYVTAELDGGPAVLQGRLPLQAGESEATLSARVHQIEHIIYPRVLGWAATGRLTCTNGLPQLDGAPLLKALVEDFDV